MINLIRRMTREGKVITPKNVASLVRDLALVLTASLILGSSLKNYIDSKKGIVKVADPSVVRKLQLRSVFDKSREQVAEQPIPNSYDFVRCLPGQQNARVVGAYEKIMGYQGRKYDSKKGWVRTRARTPEDDSFKEFEGFLSRKMDERANNYSDIL